MGAGLALRTAIVHIRARAAAVHQLGKSVSNGVRKIMPEPLLQFYEARVIVAPLVIRVLAEARSRSERVPAIVYVCGHAPSWYGAKTQYQLHGISFAKTATFA